MINFHSNLILTAFLMTSYLIEKSILIAATGLCQTIKVTFSSVPKERVIPFQLKYLELNTLARWMAML